MTNWDDIEDHKVEWPKGIEWVLMLYRGVTIATVVFGLLLPLWICRLFGYYEAGQHIVQTACKISLRVLRIPLIRIGRPMQHAGAVVSNHASWLDIFSLNAAQRVYFVSKAEVNKWPGIGLLARSAGTLFIQRRSTEAVRQKAQFLTRLKAGHKLLFFPEGTSTDSRRVLPFKSSLFAAFLEPDLRELVWIQPVTLNYIAPKGEDPRYYGWWGEMAFAPHLLKALMARKQGRIEVVFHDPIKAENVTSRKALAAECETVIRGALKA